MRNDSDIDINVASFELVVAAVADEQPLIQESQDRQLSPAAQLDH